MIQAPLYNQSGELIGNIDLNEKIFGVKPKSSVVHQVFTAMLANARLPWADTKDRGEVRGGGKKPWKQKGTGRARHGSIRSPIWKGGGVTFGPKSIRTYKQKINKKMSQTATKMCLSDKVADQKFIVLETVVSNGKTKPVFELRKKMPGFGKNTLLLVDSVNTELKRATSNIQKLQAKKAVDASVVDLLNNQYVIISKDGLGALEKRLA